MLTIASSALSLVEEQFGIVARYQLLRSMPAYEVDELVQRGHLIPVERGVYRHRGGAVVPEQAAMAAVLRARPKARVTGPFVLGLLDVDGFTTADPFEVLRRRDRRIRNVAFRHRADPLPSEHKAKMRGLPIVTPTRALVDSARFVEQLGERRLRVGLDSARWRGLTTTDRVRELAVRLGRRDPGARYFLDVLGEDMLTPESEAERGVGVWLRRFDPSPEPQVWVLPDVRVDWYLRPLRLALEYFGEVDHATAAARLADAERTAKLAPIDVEVVPIVHADLGDEDGFLGWMQAVFVARAHRLGVAPPTLRPAR